jgi:LemA protein
MIALYNRLISLKSNRENAFSDIDVQLKLRFDLVPNVVNTVKWYAKHEKDVLKEVIEARNGFMNAKTIEWKVEANNNLNSALKTLFAVAEAYPELKANENFLHLQEELADIENKLAAARRYFNSATKEYNIAVQTFPSVLIARMFWFQTYEYFEIDDQSEKKAPKVEF